MPQAMSPGAALSALEPKLIEQQRAVRIFENYYDGAHRLRFATEKFREVFGGLFGVFTDNWCPIIVDAPVERLKIQAFTLDSEDQDKDALQIWQDSNLDAESVIVHTEAGKCGCSYILVDPTGNDGELKITGEHASQCVVLTAPGDRQRRVAGLKRFVDDDGYAYAIVYTPDYIAWYRSEKEVQQDRESDEKITWRSMPERSGLNPLGVVPLIPVYNNPGMVAGGRSDLLVAIPLQDAINKQVLDMMVSSEFQAYQQRVLTGVQTTDDEGNPIPKSELDPGPSRLWVFDNENARITQLAQASLDTYVKPIEMLIQHLAAQTRTPPHYLLATMANVSGDALKTAESGLVWRARKKILDYSEPWEEAMRLAFRVKKIQTAPDKLARMESQWADPEMKTEAERVDAAVKLIAIGIPREYAWKRAGFSPQEIARIKATPPDPLSQADVGLLAGKRFASIKE